ncbi:MAG: transaldolase family protein [Erysipelotrichaceae bacterium]|nr:transaldolase family protein [Erysipelotrichaceae bacterium]MDP3305070.1 transaldolase family protein [Erysipelotrichaceae bacterium]
MELYLDTANIKLIKQMCEIYPLSGITCNPSIVIIDQATIEELCALDERLKVCIQVIGETVEDMLADAQKILSLRPNVIVKVPVTPVGYQVVHLLSKKKVTTLATAIHTVAQALFAAQCGATYLAPYVNRICENDVDGVQTVIDMHHALQNQGSSTKIIAASFKNLYQVSTLLAAGVDAVTVSPDLFAKWIDNQDTHRAVDKFTSDWQKAFNHKHL